MQHSRGIQLVPDDVDPASLKEYEGMTFDTLRQWDVIGATCKGCGNESWLDREALEKRFGNHFLLTLQRKLRCKKCGSGTDGKFIIGRMRRD